MSKNYQKAAIRRIFALAVLIAGTCYIAATAWATTCFLPSGNCSTGRVGNEDKPNPDPDPDPNPNPNPPVDACKDFKNNSTKSEYDWKNKTSCFVCTTCTSNGNTKYNCVKNSGYSWYSSDGGHCCVSGEKWYSKMGKCCSTTSGCTCPTLKKWSNGECVCQYAKTSTGTCCEQGKKADKHLCCNAGEHAENTICCPANKHEEGGECKCDENYIPDGTGCKKKELACTYEYRQATTKDSCGLTDLNTNYQCMNTINGCQCYTQLIKVSSVTAGAGYVVPYNKISNKSATCVDSNGVTRYQTICKGTRKSTCSAYGKNYEFKPNGCVSNTYNNGFEVKGDEWGDCVGKEGKCLYEYRQATKKDSDYKTGNLDDGYKCTYSSQCHKNLEKVTSLDIRSGTPSVNPINKISNKSASCTTLNGVTKYETICEGTPKSDCFSFTNDKKFTPNGCVSDPYNNGFEVKGDEWGTCVCDTDKGAYDTIEKCRSGTKSGCMSSGGCYKTCQGGYYSTKEACLKSGTTNPGGSSYGSITLQGSCSKIQDCYKFNVNGFYIRNNTKSTVYCDTNHGNSITARISVYLLLQSSGKYATDINGKEVSDITPPGSQYPANQEYYICGAISNNIPAHVRFTLDGQEFAGPDTNLNDKMYYSDGRGICKKISFENGSVHTVWWYIESMGNIYYTCKLK